MLIIVDAEALFGDADDISTDEEAAVEKSKKSDDEQKSRDESDKERRDDDDEEENREDQLPIIDEVRKFAYLLYSFIDLSSAFF